MKMAPESWTSGGAATAAVNDRPTASAHTLMTLRILRIIGTPFWEGDPARGRRAGPLRVTLGVLVRSGIPGTGYVPGAVTWGLGSSDSNGRGVRHGGEQICS
ncbi:hypothetical protein GCM10027600_11770 [Nocardioides ginsengisegetis]